MRPRSFSQQVGAQAYSTNSQAKISGMRHSFPIFFGCEASLLVVMHGDAVNVGIDCLGTQGDSSP
jgi:hypothetical protein